MAEDRDATILEKLTGIEEAIEGLVPLLENIITQLESQAAPPKVPIATYEHLYDLTQPGPPEGELVAEVRQARPSGPVGWWRLHCTTRAAP